MAFIVPRAGREQRPVYVGRDPMTGTFRRNDEGDYRCKLSTNVLSSDVLSSDVLSLNVSSMNNLTCKTSRTSESKTDVSSPGEEYLDVPSSDMISPQEKKMVLEFCSTWRSASEIAHRIGRNRQHTLRRIIKRMVNLGLLVMEFPNTPTSPKQRYKHRE